MVCDPQISAATEMVKPQGAMKTTWNLRLLYSGLNDPQIELDLGEYERLSRQFSERYASADLAESDILLSALKDFCALLETKGEKPLMFFSYITELDSDNTEASAMLALVSERLTKAGNCLIFFDLALGNIPTERQNEILSDKRFSGYSRFLQCAFDQGKHNLTEAEEKILSLTEGPAYDMWVNGQEKLLSHQTIQWKGGTISLTEAEEMIESLPTRDRRKLHRRVMAHLKKVSDFAEAEINAIYTGKKVDDELRGYKNPYDATLLGDDVDEQTVKAIQASTQQHINISHRFFDLKRRLLGIPHLTYADRGASLGTLAAQKPVPFATGVEIVTKALFEIEPKFAQILVGYLENGQVDVYPKPGKSSGAYCSHSTSCPTFILLNHLPDMGSVITLAHEIGHAIHGELSDSQPALYRGYSMAVAEVASTFFEQVVFYNMLESMSVNEQAIALHDRINQDIQTTYRQIAFFNFELELHQLIRDKGAASKEEIAGLHNKHTSNYLGAKCKMHPDDGFYFVGLSHMRNFFYVYSYAFGCLISRAVYRMYAKDKSMLRKIVGFLSAGDSKAPVEIFKEIGIDIANPEFWDEGYMAISEDIDRLERITKKLGLRRRHPKSPRE